jgi:uncharacterized protein (TIGR02246 family)
MAYETAADDESTIRELDDAWGKAASAKDLEAVVAFYAPDGSLVWPGAPAALGTDRIREQWAELMADTPGLNLRFDAERIVVSGDGTLASDFGKVEFGHDDDSGRHIQETGKYVVVWRKEQGAWKVLYDSYNMNDGG